MVMVEERHAKVAGACVKADGKFQPSGISGEVPAEVTLSSPRDARRLELSVCYHTGTSHFRTPSFLPSYHRGTVAVTPASVNLNILLGYPSSESGSDPSSPSLVAR